MSKLNMKDLECTFSCDVISTPMISCRIRSSPSGFRRKRRGFLGRFLGPSDLHGSRSLRWSGGLLAWQARGAKPEVQRGGPDGRGERWHVAPHLGWCSHI